MLDTNARRFVQPLLDGVARACARAGISANALTVAGMVVGVAAAALVALGHPVAGFLVLWLSGLIDAADGKLARLTSSTPMGAILDITFDRVVELSVITAIAWRFPEARLELVILAGVIAIAMSLFLSIGAAVQNRTVKSFHYAPGLGERTEAFICLSLMIVDSERLVLWLSGLIDAADGTLARLTNSSSPLGAILDITFDRVVELSMITALAWRFPDARFELVILAGVIAIAMSLFLSIGAAVANRTVKSFHYAPGLGERTEAFICLSLMILDSERLVPWTWVFVGVIVFTMAQRLRHAREMLR